MNRVEVKKVFLSELCGIEGRILEIGFGKSNFYEKYSENAEVYGVDFSFGLISETKQFLINNSKDKKVKVVLSDAINLPFKDNSFDFIVLSFCFCCLNDPIRTLKEMQRISKNGGKILSFDHVRSNGLLGLLLDFISPFHAFLHKNNCRINRNPINYYKLESISVLCEFKSREEFVPWLFTKCIINK